MRHLVLVCLGIALLTMPLAAQQKAHEDWSAVSSLTLGTPVEVHRQDNVTISGTITGVSDSSLIVRQKKQSSATVKRENINRLYLTRKSHVARGALIGGAAGAGAGAVVGSLVCGPGKYCRRSQGVEVGLPVFGAIGVLIGTAIGAHHGRELIYQSPEPGINAAAGLVQGNEGDQKGRFGPSPAFK